MFERWLLSSFKKLFITTEYIKPAKKRTDLCGICTAAKKTWGEKEYQIIRKEAFEAASINKRQFEALIQSWRTPVGQTPQNQGGISVNSDCSSRDAFKLHLQAKFEYKFLINEIVRTVSKT